MSEFIERIPKESITGFPPITDYKAKILILGSLPSVASLEKRQYYAHPQNSFWWILSKILNFPFSISYAQKSEVLIQNSIALWDVIYEGMRKGSLDSNIETNHLKINELSDFIYKHYNLKAIFFNGQKAHGLFLKEVSSLLSPKQNYDLKLMPSTSPANAKYSREEKLIVWSTIKDYL